MDDGVAVWANRSEVVDGINFVGLLNPSAWHQMMNVNEALGYLTVDFPKVYSTNRAARSEVVNTCGTGCRTTLPCIHSYSALRAFRELRVVRNFVWENLPANSEKKLCL